ncbi:uncharacterized protein LOC114828293 [Galendromus occidentalis]|uniref:Uncharacterized protein LOC114828293 n=1 Tax=Galendromus occidentalis TaxID=34638 RepID=A0AAJ7WIX9_9ACAR|nr:uncharacterized protein LOC114828293 [Galendromus occidentalis]
MDQVCNFCRALKFAKETPGMCCAGGKVKLSELCPPPEPLATLISGSTNQSRHFLKNIRKYNSCFQMTSFGATEIIRDNYMPTFKVQGQVYHRAGSLLPLPGADHQFLQIYFMGDTNEQIDQRRRFNSGTIREIVADLQDMLHRHNELVRVFRSSLELMPTDDYVVVIKADKTPGEHAGRFNAPTSDEVAIVIVGEEFNSRDIVLRRRDGCLKRVSETHRSYDALQYPLLFWQGEDGYHFNLRMRNPGTDEETSKKVSAMNYYSYRIMIRDNAENHILLCRQLFHQYIVDMYAKIETERLLFIRLNQTKLRKIVSLTLWGSLIHKVDDREGQVVDFQKLSVKEFKARKNISSTGNTSIQFPIRSNSRTRELEDWWRSSKGNVIFEELDIPT